MSALFDELAMHVHEGPTKLSPQFLPTYNAWKAAPTDPAATGAMLDAVNPIVDAAVKPFKGSPLMRSRARRIVLETLPKYDQARSDLPTFLRNQLQSLQRISAQHDMPINVPERVVLQRRDLDEQTRRLNDRLGREPSDRELADAMGLSIPRLRKVRAWQRPVAESQMESLDGSMPAVQGRRLPREILEDFIYSDLSDRDQLILDYSLGRNGRDKLNGRQIAQALGVTPGYVSQRLGGIQERFRIVEDSGVLGGDR